ncbi:hypothetical protein QYM36_001172 [Artemia franciscana]|uniref:PiggyBac transposable element-derived protein domain-containing protein n=1 Tax=Artemia franciscana TaxID=6661 RepID=A0AA88IIQ6_ARTSF|nr:hypothetical protein QYM36_001172 [Artemia franciscana]
MSSEDYADDWLADLPVSNAESLRNLLAGQKSSSDDETDNQVDGVTEANNEPEASNDEDSLSLGDTVKKWNKKFGVRYVDPFTDCLLAINILMGVQKLQSYRDIWLSHDELRDNYISGLMNISRFSWLLTHAHLNDNLILSQKGSDNYDKLYEIRPVIDKLYLSFLRTCKPTKEQAVDKSMVNFKGPITFKQYMPMKPINVGYKIWFRANMHGFVCDFLVLTGKLADTTEFGLGEGVVRKRAERRVGLRCEVRWNLLCTLRGQTMYATSSFHQK